LSFWLFGAPAIALIAGALVFVLWKSRRLRARHRRVFAAALPKLQGDSERLVDAPRALYHGTRFADGAPMLAKAWRDECVGDLFCTGEALFLQREEQGALLSIPLGWVTEVSLVRVHAKLAGKELPMLRLRWSRGGEALQSDFSLRGGMASLERLRREIHLRQGDVQARLKPFLDQLK
jgi:hypothetical protein